MSFRELYRALFQNAPDAIIIVDEKGHILDFNDKVLDYLGYSAEEFRVMSISDFEVIESLDDTLARIQDIRRNGTQIFETQHQCKDGSIRDARVASSAVDIGNGRMVFQSILQDITDEKCQKARLEDLNARLVEFSHSAAHDLQAPLRSISFSIEEFLNRYSNELDPRATELVTQVRDGAAEMQVLMNDLIAYARSSQAGESKVVDCQKILTRVKSLNGFDDLQVEADPLPLIWGSEGRVLQLFQNLLDNASKFRSPTRELKVRISAEPKPGNQWLFRVEDNGRGIPQGQLEEIFRPFRRLYTQTEIPGTGLGLAICERIVSTHGGRIWAESAGPGSTFYFTLLGAKA